MRASEPDGASLASILGEPRQWYLLRVAPSCEAKVGYRCADLGIEAYYPRCQGFAISRLGLEPSRVSRPAMPGYVFVSLIRGREHLSLFARDFQFRDHPATLVDIEVGDAVHGPRVVSTPPIDGSLGFISDASGPRVVPREIVKDLAAREEAGEFDEIAFAPGQRFYVPKWVRRGVTASIVEGPFAGQKAEIRKLISSKAVGISLQGRWKGKIIIPIAWLAK